VSDFSEVLNLVSIGDSQDVVKGGWEVNEERFNSLGNFFFIVEEREVSLEKSDGFILDKIVVLGNDRNGFVDVGDEGDDGCEVFNLDGFLKSSELINEDGGVIDEAIEVVNDDGGVCFFEESLSTKEEIVKVDFNSLDGIVDLEELSVNMRIFAVVNQDLEDFSEVLTGGDEVTALEVELEGVEFGGEDHEIGEEASGKGVLGQVSHFKSNGLEEGSDESDTLSA